MRITVDDCGQGWLEIANPLERTNGKQRAPNQSSDYDSISFLSSNYKCRYGKANRCKFKRKTDYRASKI